jgi:hypothetical protein
MHHVSRTDLEAGLSEIRCSPRDGGRVELIVRRPTIDGREVLPEAVLDPMTGLVGDSWPARPSSKMPDRSPHPGMQLTIMNARAAALIAGPTSAEDAAARIDRRALAGDQLYLDLDLSEDNLPPGSRLELGSAIVEITGEPHLGCAKFSARFGVDAVRFVNSGVGRALRLRGVNTRIVVGGTVRTGDTVRLVSTSTTPTIPTATGARPAPEAVDSRATAVASRATAVASRASAVASRHPIYY